MKEYRVVFGASKEANIHYITADEEFAKEYLADQKQWYSYTALESREVSEWEEV